ncbi:serine/threonine-protein kinase [Pseudofrankia sp. DC12]|uniref:WD40 repeat domain-containing serine/threonine protein kinase n=1 Tax=Pseudofrankia sp. DC12 TaxID=683315 RepID=UPI000A873807|nr:serine/threonine-protein kinase [Pseudofrankia sp. DC12]
MSDVPAGVEPLDDFDPHQLGPYTLLGRLGHGGMGTVYLGRRAAGGNAAAGPSTGTSGAADAATVGPLVAIKVIRPELATVAEFRERFAREARAAQSVHNAYTAALLDVNITGSRPYLVTEYVDGPTLSDRIRANGPLPAAQLEWLAGAVADALRAIHAAGVIHRDLKPSNILLSPFGARVIDFGIARALDTTTMATQSAIGTPAFMAPEQVLNQGVTPAVDIHAWGAVLVFAATGSAPFAGDTIPTVMRRVLEETPDLSRIPGTLRPLAARALAKEPAARPTAAQLGDAVRQIHTPPSTPASGLSSEDADGPATRPQGPMTGPPPFRRPVSTTSDPSSTPLSRSATNAPAPADSGFSEASTRRADPGPAGKAVPADGPGQEPGIQPGPRRRRRTVLLAAGAAVVVLAATVTAFALNGGLGGGPSTPSATAAVTASASADFRALGEPLTDAKGEVWGVAVTPNGKTLAAASQNGTMALWDISRPAQPRALPALSTGDTTGMMAVAFAPGGLTLASASRNGTVQLWDVSVPSAARRLGVPLVDAGGGPAWSVGFSPVGNLLASGDHSGTVRLWNVSNLKAPSMVGQPFHFDGGEVWFVAFSPDGSILATAGQDGSVGLWDVSNPQSQPQQLGVLPVQSGNGVKAVESLAFTPDGRTLITGSIDHAVRLWDISVPSVPRLLAALSQPNQVWAVALAFDGHTLATAGADRTIRLWDVSVPSAPRPVGNTLSGHTDTITKLAFGPDGRMLVSGSRDNTVRLWTSS